MKARLQKDLWFVTYLIGVFFGNIAWEAANRGSYGMVFFFAAFGCFLAWNCYKWLSSGDKEKIHDSDD